MSPWDGVSGKNKGGVGGVGGREMHAISGGTEEEKKGEGSLESGEGGGVGLKASPILSSPLPPPLTPVCPSY